MQEDKQIVKEVLYNIIEKIENKKIEKKQIKFNDIIYYCYIPNKDEIIEENIKNEIWWTSEEMEDFRFTFNNELQEFMQVFPHNNIRTVIKHLWLVFDFDEIYRNQK